LAGAAANGGDTDADGSTTVPAGGDWAGISISGSGSSFNKVSFLYGGGAASGDDVSALAVASDYSVSVIGSIFAHNRPATDSLIAAPALDLSRASPALGTTVRNTLFYDNTVPLAINAKLSLDDSNVFDNAQAAPSNPQPNRYNGVIVDGCSTVVSTTRWEITKVPLVVGDPISACSYLNIDGTGRLTLAGVTMKFFVGGAIYVDVNGTLSVGAGSWLTGIKDDHRTDTNGDGSETVPAVGDWNGIKYYHADTSPTCDASAHMHYNLPNEPDGSCSW
jgi:hypothetical protein